ncbi:flagellar hook-basal body complex protein FliE [Variovorax terrae]|uniref:Flagellar hook-basal body complex protein FliE n=1 Tax=Variovorax terrae TaxID=2923278 RepID=A0A9X1VWI5_9BURK|nr:flagellar hook-basal body complex protein FliE [Variovorax terrae]MCJ0764544.1 flagellar hook-basal body complex protein FliE [Variovorax terrae]
MSSMTPIELVLPAVSAQLQAGNAAEYLAPTQALRWAGDVTGVNASSASFGALVSQGLTQINQQLTDSQVDLQRLAVGDAQNLHQIMIGLEESRLSFQLMLQVRNRLLEAYQDVMKMQI